MLTIYTGLSIWLVLDDAWTLTFRSKAKEPTSDKIPR